MTQKFIPTSASAATPESDAVRTAQEITSVAASLSEIENGDRPRLQEFIFREVFLPFFSGSETPKYVVDVGTWLATARSPYQSVDITDVTGEVLFTVPPLYDRGAIDATNQVNQKPVDHVVKSATQLSRLSPNQGSAYLKSELTKRVQAMKVPVNVVGHFDTWNKIFARYGLPPLLALENTDSTESTGAPSDTKPDDYEYELA